MRRSDLLLHERHYWGRGLSAIAGVDEAGRGPLAGPVVAAAVVFPEKVAVDVLCGTLAQLTDSKQLTASQREAFFAALYADTRLAIGVGISSVEEIDRINILRATHCAMRRAIEALPNRPDHILVDGLPVPGLPVGSTALVGGDALSLSIAAASVVAKVARDRMMIALDQRYPNYGFARHKGYGTALHTQALLEYGPTPEHRRSFRPVREADAIRANGKGPSQKELF